MRHLLVVSSAALAISLLTGRVSNAIAQGMLLERGESGVAVSGGYYSTKDLSGFAGTVGYSFRGIVDLGVSVERSSVEGVRVAYQVPAQLLNASHGPTDYPRPENATTSGITLAPRVAIHLRRPGQSASLVLHAAYERTWFGGWGSDIPYPIQPMFGKQATIRYDAEESGTSLGAAIYGQFALSGRTRIVPYAGYAWKRGETTVSPRYLDDYHQTSSLFVFPVGAHVLFRGPSGMRVHVSPEAELETHGRSVFSVSTGIVMTRLPFIRHVR